jgi:hypothetical protein
MSDLCDYKNPTNAVECQPDRQSDQTTAAGDLVERDP